MNINTKIGIALGTILALVTSNFVFVYADSINRQLQYGMTGSDVGTLQTFLLRDSTIYTGPVTNYFGPATRAAVIRFQIAHGLSAVGRVGPQTLALINQMLGGLGGTVISASSTKMISSVATSTSNGMTNLTWNTYNPGRGVVYFSQYPLDTYEHENSVTISGSIVQDNNLGTSHSVQIPNLLPNTTYYYTIYTTDASGNVQMTWPGLLVWGVNSQPYMPINGSTTPSNGSSTMPNMYAPINVGTSTGTTTTGM
jgi:peptidoglycan hydrolase-like protein with peptidoglycan-binding domain